MLDIGVLVSGGGTNLQSIIDAIETKRLNAAIKAVISNRPGAYAIERAKKHGIPFEVVTKDGFATRQAYDENLAGVLKARNVELVVLAGFMRIITRPLLEAFPMRIVNIHPSLLPSFPGLDVQKKAIEYGARFSGCTVHFVDDGVDTGPIIIQAAVPVLEGDTPETLSKRILAEEHRIYPQAIQLISEGKVEVRDRRVHIKGAQQPGGTLENPAVTIFDAAPKEP